MPSSNGINRVSHNANRPTCGVGYVVCSVEQTVAEYIQGCYRNNRVNIITERGEVVKNCLVNVDVWQTLEFPANKKQRGSAVAWINVPYQNRPIVVATLAKRDSLQPVQTQNTFKFQRSFNGNNVSVTGNGEVGTLVVNVQGEEAGEGQVLYRLLSKNELALFQLYVQGKIAIDVEQTLDVRCGTAFTFTVRDEANNAKSARILYKLGEGFTFEDEFGNLVRSRGDGYSIKVPQTKTITLNGTSNAVESAILGDSTQKTLTDMLSLVESMVNTLQAASGGANVAGPPVKTAAITWTQKITALKGLIKKLLSKNVKLS